jgi:hypothetical protein
MPALWAAIYYYPSDPPSRKNLIKTQKKEPRQVSIFCFGSAELQKAIARVGTEPLHLYFGLPSGYGSYSGYVQRMPFVIREFSVRLRYDSYMVDSLEKLPALEHLELDSVGTDSAGSFLNNVEAGSTLLWSLAIRGSWFPSRLMQLPLLLKRIRRLDIGVPVPERFGGQFIMGLQNLTELT